MTARTDTERILDAFLAPEADQLPDRVLDAAFDQIARSPQRHALRLPWRFRPMSNVLRLAAAAVIGVVALGVLYLNLPNRHDVGGQTPTPSTSEVAPGVETWKSYSSLVYDRELYYPADWTTRSPATREWQAGDVFPVDGLPYADTFVSPGEGDAQIALISWTMPAGEGADIGSFEGMKAWAETFCTDVLRLACDGFARDAVAMRYTNGPASGAPILVPAAEHQYAFLGDCNSCLLDGAMDSVTVVVVAREDEFAPAARYGGSLELLKSVLKIMNVWPADAPPYG
jgi:hypothetical protein